MYDRARLIELFRKHALKLGDFTLASGQKSTYYLDGRLITLRAEGLRLISQGILERLAGVDFAAVGGMSIGADPIVGGVLTVAAERGRPLVGFLVRKQAKEHGTRRAVEGPVERGSNVVIVEDVIGGPAEVRSRRLIASKNCRLPRRLRHWSLRPPARGSSRLRRPGGCVSHALDDSRSGNRDGGSGWWMTVTARGAFAESEVSRPSVGTSSRGGKEFLPISGKPFPPHRERVRFPGGKRFSAS